MVAADQQRGLASNLNIKNQWRRPWRLLVVVAISRPAHERLQKTKDRAEDPQLRPRGNVDRFTHIGKWLGWDYLFLQSVSLPNSGMGLASRPSAVVEQASIGSTDLVRTNALKWQFVWLGANKVIG
jgi:hypothetical protein